MSRNLRKNLDHPAPNPVNSYEIAPHHYFDGFNDTYREAKTYNEYIRGIPYNVGDVVWCKYGDEIRLAFISDLFCEYTDYGRIEKFRVHIANKAGDRFAKNWVYIYPGYIQRGYNAKRFNN